MKKNFGREDAKILLKSFEKVTEDEIYQKWYETKSELKEDLLREIATKRDLEILRKELLGKIESLYEKTEKDKAELLGKTERDKAELLGKIEKDKAELLNKIELLYEKTEKDKAELLGKIEKDKTELLGKIEKHKAELLGKIEKDKTELLGKIEKDKAELLGKLGKIDLTLKFLIILNIIALTLMNPVVAELIKKLFRLG